MSNDIVEPSPIEGRAALNPNIIIGALFGLITLLGLFLFAYLAATNPNLCSRFQFQLLAGGFALGAGLSGSFIGGGAGAQGKGDYNGYSLRFGLGGGAALLIVSLVVFSLFAPQGCDARASLQQAEQLKSQVQELEKQLASTNAAVDSLTKEREALNARIDHIASVLKPITNELEANIASANRATQLLDKSCPGGSSGVDSIHEGDITALNNSIAQSMQAIKAEIQGLV